MSKSSAEFSAWLRGEAVRLASGEIDEVYFSDSQLDAAILEGDRKKINASYIRMVMNRVAEVKEVGRVSVTRTDGIEMAVGFLITLNREPKRKVYTDEDMPAIKQKIRNQVLKDLIGRNPKFTDMQDEALAVAVEMIRRYDEMFKGMIEEGK